MVPKSAFRGVIGRKINVNVVYLVSPLGLSRSLKRSPSLPKLSTKPWKAVCEMEATKQLSFDFLTKKPYAPPSWASHLSPIPSHVFSLAHVPTPIHKWNLPNLPKNTQLWIKMLVVASDPHPKVWLSMGSPKGLPWNVP
ncbi:Bifunctional D-cysteine desulfhydrase/1-aminocyclopropane-1-carboxylate deaminase, mitochondrial [Vitis vinifera]|uniref:Bifunctional D-cysteine desulfhydrase/1-aminocyclopropane-1-carboxylate deaminase, mitochondrial n=1 Tax=Vitis vinifera TaxID=29760 RepID=A0A438HHI3_VITVI|nr:Bifunctional D-cysteine desulfhydrase/1-aminocyclopropane-1-carboxylate deaminase, mitochondrial [Vitis vinifera]